MTGRATMLARLRARRVDVPTARPRTVGELLAMLGRLALWLAVGLVLVRGVGGMAATESASAPHARRAAPLAVWPDDAARAFAVEFATAYLAHDPSENASDRVRVLEAFASPELAAQLAPRFEQGEPRAAVGSAAVAATVRLDHRRALVTVAATLAAPEPARRLVTVPVARDGRGGLVVYDLPSFAPAPGRATVGAPEVEPLLGSERAAITDVLVPFLRAYLAGDGAALAYLVPPGTQMRAAAGRWELIDVTSLSALGPPRGAERTVLATAQARDPRLRVTYALRYRVRLVRRDRWYVAEVNGPERGERDGG